MFHITNGDYANDGLMQAGITGEFLSWDDVLHEGPVPGGLDLHELSLIRAKFISFCGWATEFEAQTHFQTRDARFLAAVEGQSLVIWNSPELFDQLHLLQVLGSYPIAQRQKNPPRLAFIDGLLVNQGLDAEQAAQALAQAQPVTPAQWQQADQLWQLFQAGNPRGLAAAAAEPIPEFRWMQAALQRLLQEYPDGNGVSRTERAALQAVAQGADRPAEMFRHVRAQEAVPFMGDASFWQIVATLCNSEQPLLARADGQPFALPDLFAPSEAFQAQQLCCTEAGQAILSDELDWLDAHTIDRWLGGVHLNPDNRWRWDGRSFQRG